MKMEGKSFSNKVLELLHKANAYQHEQILTEHKANANFHGAAVATAKVVGLDANNGGLVQQLLELGTDTNGVGVDSE